MSTHFPAPIDPGRDPQSSARARLCIVHRSNRLAGEQDAQAAPVLQCSTPPVFTCGAGSDPFSPKLWCFLRWKIPPMVPVQSLGTVRLSLD